MVAFVPDALTTEVIRQADFVTPSANRRYPTGRIRGTLADGKPLLTPGTATPALTTLATSERPRRMLIFLRRCRAESGNKRPH
jgi:hypothetical protein